MTDETRSRRFEQAVLPHLDAAYNLARWLTRNHHDAEDIMQEAALRAFRFFDGFKGGDSRAWLLAIVRNTGVSWLKRNHPAELDYVAPETLEEVSARPAALDAARGPADPERQAICNADHRQVNQAIAALPIEFREVLVLREVEDLSYRQIAEIVGIPMGTVMSRLSRARRLLSHTLANRHEVTDGL